MPMRVCYFVLFACTATFTGSANAWGTSSPTMTKAELAADVRSTHADCDGIAVKKPLEVHDRKTGEERMAPATTNLGLAIQAGTYELITALRSTYIYVGDTRQARLWQKFNREAIKHYVMAQIEGPRKIYTWVVRAILAARENSNELVELLKAAQEAYRAHLEAEALSIILKELYQFDTHPLEVLRMSIATYKDVDNPGRHSAVMIFEDLEMYIKNYNAKRPDTPPVAMLPTLYHGFGDVAKLASFLSEVQLHPVHAQAVERMGHLMMDYLTRLTTMIKGAAEKFGIPTQGQIILAHHNLDFFVRCISTVLSSLPSEHQIIFALLSMMFGKNQAVFVMEKAREVSSSMSSDAALNKKLQAEVKALRSNIAAAHTLLSQEH